LKRDIKRLKDNYIHVVILYRIPQLSLLFLSDL